MAVRTAVLRNEIDALKQRFPNDHTEQEERWACLDNSVFAECEHR